MCCFVSLTHPIVEIMKSGGKTLRTCGDYPLTLNPRLRRYASTTMNPEVFIQVPDRQPILPETRPGKLIPTDSTITKIRAINHNYYSVGLTPVQLYARWPPRIL